MDYHLHRKNIEYLLNKKKKDAHGMGIVLGVVVALILGFIMGSTGGIGQGIIWGLLAFVAGYLFVYVPTYLNNLQTQKLQNTKSEILFMPDAFIFYGKPFPLNRDNTKVIQCEIKIIEKNLFLFLTTMTKVMNKRYETEHVIIIPPGKEKETEFLTGWYLS
jgi:hypothetical protein